MQPDPLGFGVAERAALVPDVVRHAQPAEVMDQPGPADLAGDGLAEPVRGGRLTGEVGDPARVAERVRGLHVGEVRDRLQRRVERGAGQPDPERGLGAEHGIPAAGLVQPGEQGRRVAGEDVHDLGVELGAAPLPGHLDRRLRAIGPVEHLDDVRERDQARGDEDVRATRSFRHSLAVPPLEGLLDAVAHPLGEAELRRQRVRSPPVVLQHRVSGPAPVADERDSEPGPFRERPVSTEVAQDEQGPVGLGGEVGPAEVGLQRGVVTEPLRLLVGVDVAAHPGDE